MRPSDFLGKSINFYPQVARVVGGIKPALMLSQLIYWTGKQHDSDGWIFKTHSQFQEELAMTREEQDSARKQLKSLGLIEYEVRGRPPKIHYRVNQDRLDVLICGKASNQICGKSTDEFAGNAQIDLRETRKCYIEPENTSKNTNNNGILGNPFVKPKYAAGQFESFWSLYPKKTEKKAAQRAWLKVPASVFPNLMSRLRTFIEVDWLGKEKALIPNPATWLNGERWNDEIIPPAKLGGNGNGYHKPEPDTPLYHQPFDRKKYDYENQA